MAQEDPPALAQQQSNFASLPDELILSIVSHLSEDAPSLAALALTCRALRYISEPLLYTTIKLLSTKDLTNYLLAFSARPARVEAVQSLQILYRYDRAELGASAQKRAVFNQWIVQMKALKDWWVESPYDNFKFRTDDGSSEWVEWDMEQFRVGLERVSLQRSQGLGSQHGLGKLEKRKF
jgi:hypothetical protein